MFDLIPGTTPALAQADRWRQCAINLRRVVAREHSIPVPPHLQEHGIYGAMACFGHATRLDGALVTEQLPARTSSRIAYRKRQRAAKRHG